MSCEHIWICFAASCELSEVSAPFMQSTAPPMWFAKTHTTKQSSNFTTMSPFRNRVLVTSNYPQKLLLPLSQRDCYLGHAHTRPTVRAVPKHECSSSPEPRRSALPLPSSVLFCDQIFLFLFVNPLPSICHHKV